MKKLQALIIGWFLMGFITFLVAGEDLTIAALVVITDIFAVCIWGQIKKNKKEAPKI